MSSTRAVDVWPAVALGLAETSGRTWFFCRMGCFLGKVVESLPLETETIDLLFKTKMSHILLFELFS